ncbi:MAG TPA: hypothetical protein VEJ45_11540 [Candidatus Acidoferrales bacterium]|nr:hypothetical protein [Candidatus Acidoferrales bacterium]
MRHALIFFAGVLMLLAFPAPAQQNPTSAAATAAHTIDGHPDLSGIWQYSIDLPAVALKKQVNGSVEIKKVDLSGRRPAKAPIPGALPFTEAPSYKPEFQAKVKYLFDNEAKLDKVFFCGRPGVPRIGSPRQIIQLPNELIFLYEDMSGDPYRIIPTDGRPHRADADPSYYGDSVGHWEGDTLVVDATNLVDETWFGEGGYFHTSAMHVTERFWKVGDNLAYQVTVDDPNVLTEPWTEAPRLVKPSDDALQESPACVEDDAKRMLNLDHHGQR